MTPARRWLILALLLVAGLLVVLARLDGPPRPTPAPVLRLADAGLPPVPGVRPALASRGHLFPSGVFTPTTGRLCLKGRVVNARSGAPVPRAIVRVATFGGALEAASSDDGTFGLEAPAEGRVSLLEVVAPGFEPLRPELDGAPVELELVDGACATDVTLGLEPRLRLTGEVLDEAGPGVAGAAVSVRSLTQPPRVVATTSDAGRFELEGVEGDTLAITHEGFQSALLVLDAKALVARHLLVVLRRADVADAGPRRLWGLVVDDADAGVADARVRVRLAGEGADGETLVAVVETGAGGAFDVPLEAAGPFRVEASAGARAALPVETTGGPVVLRLSATARVEGQVSTGGGHPVQSFAVLVRRLRGDVEGVALPLRHVIHPEGRFSLLLPEGPVEVVVVAPGLSPSAPARVLLRADAPARLDVTLDEGATVVGRVVDRVDGRPLPGARLSLERSQPSALTPQVLVRADGDGRFRLPGVPFGRHSVLVEADGYDARLTTVDAPPRGEVGPLELYVAPVPDGGTPRLELVGIGAVLKAEGDGVILDTLVPGGGAAEAGLTPGDVVLSVDGQRVARLGFAGTIERLRGAEGSEVLLEVQRSGGALERVTLRRRRVVR
ncbi:MAG: carboxypeptidase regulatory-like domain-containing protein [Myxococcaceae bacterium]|jgi:hypothetical protein|nr:carboxypeptidase regulatory-like domain-containing protein [Myxococcaceae bacterium]MCA3014809.1 carboxypeptidase regulatory-like domain-containing protein [Myxococcaceae bacterium]